MVTPVVSRPTGATRKPANSRGIVRCFGKAGLVIAIAVAAAIVAVHSRRVCHQNMARIGLPFLCLTGLAQESVSETAWQDPAAAWEAIHGERLPRCPLGARYSIRYVNDVPGPIACRCPIHGRHLGRE